MIVAGASLLHYRVVEKIGEGGMGAVWKATDATLDRDVAIKVLPPDFASDAERLARFEREAKVLASLNHPNIGAIYGFHEANGVRFLAMELVPGEDLAERLKKGSVPSSEAADMARQIAEALEYAHERGIVHRDLKPANIKITPDGTVKVLDFGLAKAVVGDPTASSPTSTPTILPTMTSAGTAIGMILGTAAYMSPEQARGKPVDKRADIWAFGVVMFEILAGRRLFEGETVSDTMAAVLTRDPEWGAIPKGTPKRLVELLKRCLRKDPRERLRDIGDARVELAEIAKGGAAPEDPTAALAPRRRVWPIAVATAIVGALATGAVMRGLAPAPASETLRVMVQAPDKQKLSPETPDIVLSPDGSTIAIVASDESGVAHIWLRSFSSEQTRMVNGTDGARMPFWSPDGRHLGFFADHKLKRVSIGGEGLQVLCPAPSARGGSWGAGDAIVFAPNADGPIMTVPASGGEAKPVTTFDAAAHETGHRLPSFLPDGRRFLYAVVPEGPDGYSTKVGSLDGKPGPTVMKAKSVALYARPGYLLYLTQDNVFARPFDAESLQVSGTPRAIPDVDLSTGGYAAAAPFSVGPDGTILQRASTLVTERLEALDRQGKSIGKLPVPDGTFLARSLSPDRRRLAFGYTKPGEQTIPIYVLDLSRGIFSRFTFDGPNDQAPAWTPDGRRVIWASDRPGGRNFYWKNADGSGAEELLADAPGPFNDVNDVTADGKWLVYTSYGGETGEDLWMVDLDGKHESRPLLKTKASELDATISPDGRWFAYRSDESGEFELYAQPFPELGRRVRLTAHGALSDVQNSAVATRWRSDGKEILCTSPDGRTQMSIPVELGAELKTGAQVPLFKLPPEVDFVSPSPDGQRFYACIANQTFSRGLIRIVRDWSSAIEAAAR